MWGFQLHKKKCSSDLIYWHSCCHLINLPIIAQKCRHTSNERRKLKRSVVVTQEIFETALQWHSDISRNIYGWERFLWHCNYIIIYYYLSNDNSYTALPYKFFRVSCCSYALYIKLLWIMENVLFYNTMKVFQLHLLLECCTLSIFNFTVTLISRILNSIKKSEINISHFSKIENRRI